LWKSRGLYTDDLESMNEREAEKYVKKDNIWKKPDYQAMIDEGIPLGVWRQHNGKKACQTERIY